MIHKRNRQPVDDHTEADNGGVPTAAPEALAVGLRGVGETIHDTETMGEGSRDYTLNRVEVYDTIEDSPFLCPSVYQTLPMTPIRHGSLFCSI